MTTIEVPTIETSELRARASFQAGAIAVQFAGSADSRAGAPIVRLLTKLHEEATRLSVREVVVDFREFDFMNSSCFKAFVTWIGTIQEAEPEKQYRIRFLSDEGKHWQQRSLDALRCFAVDIIQIDA